MTRGCTDDIAFVFEFALANISQLKCTFEQRGHGIKLVKSLSDFTQDAANKKISITLTQAETLGFIANVDATIQIKVLFTDNKSGATTVMSIPVSDEQYGEVLQ